MANEPLTEISKTLKAQDKAKKQARDASGKFVSVSGVSATPKKSDYPPMVSVTLANPITYLKLWWKNVMSGEGIDVKLRIHPVTAILLALIICGAGFGLGRLTFPSDNPIVKYIPSLGPSPTEVPYKQGVYAGIVQKSYSTNKYYLMVSGETVLALSFPINVDPEKLLGKRILVEGRYNILDEVLYVSDASDMEYLPPSVSPIPTAIVTPILVEDTPTPTEAVTPEEYNFEEPTL